MKTLPPDAARSALRNLLSRLEPPDCDCELNLSCPCGESCPPGADCVHCRGECDCPPELIQPRCHHACDVDPGDRYLANAWYDRLCPGNPDATWLERLAVLQWHANAGEYAESPAIPDTESADHEARILLMQRRASAQQTLRHPRDLSVKRDSSLATVGVPNVRNGAKRKRDDDGEPIELEVIRERA